MLVRSGPAELQQYQDEADAPRKHLWNDIKYDNNLLVLLIYYVLWQFDHVTMIKCVERWMVYVYRYIPCNYVYEGHPENNVPTFKVFILSLSA